MQEPLAEKGDCWDFYQKARKFCVVTGNYQWQDDFPAYAAQRFLEYDDEERPWINMRYVFLDFLRVQFGREHTPRGVACRKIYFRQKDFDEEAHGTTDDEKLLPYAEHLQRLERIAIILKMKWGFVHEEIAEVFGWTIDSTHVFMCQTIKKLRRAARGESEDGAGATIDQPEPGVLEFEGTISLVV